MLQYGKVIPEYVDNHPPEALTRVREGGHYGWPFCNPNPDTPSGLERVHDQVEEATAAERAAAA